MAEKLVEEAAGINIPFVRGFIYDNVVGDSRASCYLFNNLKWFTNTWPLDELYKTSNVNSPVNYNLEGIVNITF